MSARGVLLREKIALIPAVALAKRSLARAAGVLLLGAVLAGGCTAPGGDPTGETPAADDLATVVLELTSVPFDVRCVRVVVTGNEKVIRTFEVNPGFPASLTLIGLPIGNATVYPESFNVSCADIGPTTAPTWVGQAQASVVLASGKQVSANVLLLVRPSGVNLGLDYQAGVVRIAPAIADFGSAVIAGFFPQPLTFTVVNGALGTVPGEAVLTGPDAPQFRILMTDCPMVMMSRDELYGDRGLPGGHRRTQDGRPQRGWWDGQCRPDGQRRQCRRSQRRSHQSQFRERSGRRAQRLPSMWW